MEELLEFCKDENCDITPALYAEFPAIAQKYKAMEKALEWWDNAHEEHCSFGSPNGKGGMCECDCFHKIAQEALSLDPLSDE